jgi:hypothetical protein
VRGAQLAGVEIVQVVDPRHGDRLIPERLDRRTRIRAGVAPHPRRRQIAVELLLDLDDRDLVGGGSSR